jgi:hypothetical protein
MLHLLYNLKIEVSSLIGYVDAFYAIFDLCLGTLNNCYMKVQIKDKNY